MTIKLSDLEGIYLTCLRKLDDGGSLKRKVPAKACVLHSLKKANNPFVSKHRKTLYPFCVDCKAWKEQLRHILNRREGAKIKEKIQNQRARRKKL